MKQTVKAALATLALAPVFGAGPAPAAERLPEGKYSCVMLSGSMLMTLGTLDIDGDKYRGFSGDRWSTYRMAADGIEWTGSFAGMPEGFVLKKGQLTGDGQGRPLIEVYYTSISGWSQVIDCTRE